MATQKPARPSPYPGLHDKPFWEFTAKHEFRLPRCAQCGKYQWPPAAVCAGCLSDEYTWERVSGVGTVLSWVVFSASIFRAYRRPITASSSSSTKGRCSSAISSGGGWGHRLRSPGTGRFPRPPRRLYPARLPPHRLIETRVTPNPGLPVRWALPHNERIPYNLGSYRPSPRNKHGPDSRTQRMGNRADKRCARLGHDAQQRNVPGGIYRWYVLPTQVHERCRLGQRRIRAPSLNISRPSSLAIQRASPGTDRFGRDLCRARF